MLRTLCPRSVTYSVLDAGSRVALWGEQNRAALPTPSAEPQAPAGEPAKRDTAQPVQGVVVGVGEGVGVGVRLRLAPMLAVPVGEGVRVGEGEAPAHFSHRMALNV